MRSILFLCTFYFSGLFYCHAQDLASIGKSKALTFSGVLNAYSTSYRSWGTEQRRNPFTAFVTGNLQAAIYGWSIPISFSYTNDGLDYQQPFNSFTFRPTYKATTLHIGYSSMVLSNYSVNGHLFRGIGLEMAPNEKTSFQFFYGRLNKAVISDTSNVNNLPAYKRTGGGLKLKYGTQQMQGSLILFKSWDDVASLENVFQENDLKPEENFVLGTEMASSITDRVSIRAEWSTSVVTQDSRAEKTATVGLQKLASVFLPIKVSTASYHAYKASFEYSLKRSSIGLAYERVDPGYRTHGAYFFNNNIENIALTGNCSTGDNKFRTAAQLGIQRNNLDNKQLSTMERLSGSINVHYNPLEKFAFSLGFSNFQTVVNFRVRSVEDLVRHTPFTNPDTLNYKQISQSATFNVNYIISSAAAVKQNISMNCAVQRSADSQGGTQQSGTARFYNLNSSYTVAYRKTSLLLSTNATISTASAHRSLLFGPTVSLRKSFENKKLAMNFTFSHNRSHSANKVSITNLRVSGNYTLKEKHLFDLGVTNIHRNGAGIASFSELSVQLGYSYNFSI